ncbi:hypothetical protein [Leucobacter luti]|uniref:hypothetical protein n=1 Tax=Leucobacter luti TaxID=340320 RepID=UPI003D0930F6
MRRIGFIHSGSHFQLACLNDPAVVALDVVDCYAPELDAKDLEGLDALFVSARLHPGVIPAIAPLVLDFLAGEGRRVYVDGENSVGEWLPGTGEEPRGTNFWGWRVGEDVGRRSVNRTHPFWDRLSERSVHWHYHGVLTHPSAAVPLVRLEEIEDPPQSIDPWGLPYRALPDHPNTLLYVDSATFVAEIVVSTMDAAFHHGSGFMPGATQLFYRMLRWLGEPRS